MLKNAWEFNMLDVSKAIFQLRQAISLPGLEAIDRERRAQIYTNLGKALNFLGRFVEAQEYWGKAIESAPGKATALANRGKKVNHYGKYLFDDSHQKVSILYSYQLTRLALQDKDDSIEGFRNEVVRFFYWLEKNIPENFRANFPELNNYSFVDDPELKAYRRWCLNFKLFINPLNDLGTVTIACHDCLNMPTMTFPFKLPPTHLSFTNQIKQEYGTARSLFYGSLTNQNPHISDTDIVILDTMETTLHSYTIEQAKLSFRMAYSLFDEISFFLNDYLQLNIEKTRINFKTVWYDNYKKKGFKTPFFFIY